jgi:hypothetical protein
MEPSLTELRLRNTEAKLARLVDSAVAYFAAVAALNVPTSTWTQDMYRQSFTHMRRAEVDLHAALEGARKP